MGSEMNDLSASVVIVCLLIAFYFIPTLVACFRGHRDSTAIFALNFLLGWTFIGWVAALVWSLTGNVHERIPHDRGRSYADDADELSPRRRSRFDM